MNIKKPQIHIITKNFSHHSNYSGYDRLLDFIPTVPLPRFGISRVCASRYKEKLSSECVAEVDGYRLDEVNTELDIMWYFSLSKHIFHFLYGENCFCYSKYGFKRNKAILATYHQPESWFKMYGNVRYDYFASKLKLLDGVIAVSEDQASFFRQFNDNVFCVHHGIDTDFFSPDETVPAKKNTCLFVGNWLRDFDTLKECSRILRHKYPDFELHVVTPEKNKKLLDDADVQFFSSIDDHALRNKYRSSTVALLPLKDCTANNSALEAMACGLPLVVSDIGGIRDYATEDCAIFCEPGNAEQMVESAVNLATNVTALKKMGAAARARAESCFAWPIIANKMKAVYANFQ